MWTDKTLEIWTDKTLEMWTDKNFRTVDSQKH